MKAARGLFIGGLLLILTVATTSFTQGRSGEKKDPSHTARQTRPIQLGTSGGNAKDKANGFCCSGTLGSLIEIHGKQFILSNSHVFAGDIVDGGNGRVSTKNDPIIQPGLVDVFCQTSAEDHVARLSSLSTLVPGGASTVDAAIAEVTPGAVDDSGAILEIGTISSRPVAAFPGQKVKKSGRTTGLTRSTIDSVNATVTVGYYSECGGSTFTTTFTGQILIKNKGGRFLGSGDSGSLMVEDVNSNPRPIGLLFAGSSSIAAANPIGDVLAHFGATIVGNTSRDDRGDVNDQQRERDVARAMRTQQLNAHKLSDVPKSVGHAIGVSEPEVTIKILVEELTAEALSKAPKSLDGFRVIVEEIGKITAFSLR